MSDKAEKAYKKNRTTNFIKREEGEELPNLPSIDTFSP